MKSYVKPLLLLLIPLALIVAYALWPTEIGSGDWMLEKADLSELGIPTPELPAPSVIVPAGDSLRLDSVSKPVTDSLPAVAERGGGAIRVSSPDSTKFRILFFGDSMLEGLGKRMCDYAMENDYDLTSVIWYSSSTKLWAETDTLQYFLDRVRPDYVMLCLGSNELFVRDLDKRDRYISSLVQKLSPYPFVWISPPNWKPDTGINELIIKHIGVGRYFDSRSLELERSSDHAHPTHTAAALWMDTVASWMRSSANVNRLRLDPPTVKRPRKFHQYLLKPVQ